MEKIDAINWMEQWGSRHDVRVRSHRRIRPGEERAGLVMEIVGGQLLSAEALEELLAMERQLVFSEMAPVPAVPGPASGARERAAPAQDCTLSGDEPPVTNRGGRVTSEVFKGFDAGGGLFAGVDQFTLVGKGPDSRVKLVEVLGRYFGQGQEELWGRNTYRQSCSFDGGASVNWSDGREDWCVVVTGQALQLVGESGHVQFIQDLHEHADHCTRVDPRLDDYSRRVLDLGQVREAMGASNVVGPRKWRIETSGRFGRAGLEGETLYFGSRDGALIRFYDKGLESKERILSNRCEVEYHKDKAQAAWLKLIDASRQGVTAFTRAVGELVCGAIDFRDRSKHKHLERMERLPWWAAVVDRLGRVTLRVEKAISSLNSSCMMMVWQYGKKFARAVVVAEAKGHDLLLQLSLVIDRLRAGQELEDVDLSPMELAFKPVAAFPLRRC